MRKKNVADKLLEDNIKANKLILIKSFENNFNIQENTLELFVNGIKHSDSNRFYDKKLIWNLAGFINIVSFDLKIIGKDLTFAESEYQKRLYCRIACLVIYEAINDIFKLLGRDFNKLFTGKILNKEIEQQLKIIRQNLNLYKSTNFEKLKAIRNVAIAHRDIDLLKQIEQIENINWSEIIKLLTEFDKILNALGSTLQQIINIELEKPMN
jgi:hypothetical protein